MIAGAETIVQEQDDGNGDEKKEEAKWWRPLERLERPQRQPRQRLLMTSMDSKPAISLRVDMATTTVETVGFCTKKKFYLFITPF